jgi:hypothetical protein
MKPSAKYMKDLADDPAASRWLKDAVFVAGMRDPLDAMGDAQSLLAFCEMRAAETLDHAAAVIESAGDLARYVPLQRKG